MIPYEEFDNNVVPVTLESFFFYTNVQYLRDCGVPVWKEPLLVTKIVMATDFSHQINSM